MLNLQHLSVPKRPAQIWAHWNARSEAAASGDGRWAFWTAQGDQARDVFCAPVAGGLVENLTFGTEDHQIRWVSHDGMQLVLAQDRGGSGCDHLLLLDRRRGNRLRLLTPKQDRHRLWGGEVLDGRLIHTSDEDGSALWQEGLETGARRMLTPLPQMARPQVGPGGVLLVGEGGGLWLWDGKLRLLAEGVDQALWWGERVVIRTGNRLRLWDGNGLEGPPAKGIVAGRRLALWGPEGVFEWRDGWQRLDLPPGATPWAEVPGGWLAEVLPGAEVWAAGRRLSPEAPRLPAPERLAEGWLYRAEGARGLVCGLPGPYAGPERGDATAGFLLALGWSLLVPDGPAPPADCRIVTAPGLRLRLEARDLPAVEMTFPDAPGGLTKPAHLLAVFDRLARLLQRLSA